MSNKVAITIGGASKAEDDHVIEEGSNEGDDYSETNSIPTTLASSEMEQLHIADKRTHFEVWNSDIERHILHSKLVPMFRSFFRIYS